MKKNRLKEVVNNRKNEIETENQKLQEFRTKVEEFINGIKEKSTIYALVKNLNIWKQLEELINKQNDGGEV